MRISILSAGAWGTAMAVALARKHQVFLWARDEILVRDINKYQENRKYLPEIHLDLETVSADLFQAVDTAELIIFATPLSGFRQMLQQVMAIRHKFDFVWLCKGFERETSFLPQQIVSDVLNNQQNISSNKITARSAVLSGPSFAIEVAQHLPTALVLASSDQEYSKYLIENLHDDLLRLYLSNDMLGIEIGGAVKNVMAIAAGVCDGLALGNNARAALISRGLAEIVRLGVKLGAKSETFMGLSGIGDLVLTCGGNLSRNRQVGLKLAKGEKLAAILDNLHHVAEGVNTAFEVQKIAEKYQVDMPINATVCKLLTDQISALDGLHNLLSRDYRSEH